ncbi:MAG: DNA polymerase IV [Erysipelotrichaceae bacterium]|nr:DNA polymerase IV [Erysipelotrichaceae bacterium]
MNRIILHCDLNSFYASVEQLYHPELRGKPLAVAGSAEHRHGIILAKNQLAKKKGVITAEAIWQAKRKCPDLVILEPHYDRYQLFSSRVKSMFLEYTDLVESFGLDEAWLDVTGSTMFGDGKQIADTLRARIRSELGITASVGVSFNKIFAKLGSDLRKPDYTTVISKDNYKQIVWPLEVDEMLYVGKSAKARLNAFGIRTIGELANEDPEDLKKYFGKNGLLLWKYANGLDESQVMPFGYQEEAKSISNNMTSVRDLKTYQDADLILLREADRLSSQLRKENVRCKEVSVVFRDNRLKSTVHQVQLDQPSDLSSEIYHAARKIMRKYWNLEIPLRSIGIRVGKLCDGDIDQLSLFTDASYREKQQKLEKTIDDIRSRFGRESIQRLAWLSDPKLCGIDEDREKQ